MPSEIAPLSTQWHKISISWIVGLGSPLARTLQMSVCPGRINVDSTSTGWLPADIISGLFSKQVSFRYSTRLFRLASSQIIFRVASGMSLLLDIWPWQSSTRYGMKPFHLKNLQRYSIPLSLCWMLAECLAGWKYDSSVAGDPSAVVGSCARGARQLDSLS